LLVYGGMKATAHAATLAGILAISGLLAPGCIIVSDDDDSSSTLRIDNQSGLFLDEIRLANVLDDSWGPNLAPRDGLEPDGILDLTNIDCDFYDLRVTDENGDGCDMFDIDLCLNDALFVYSGQVTCDLYNATGQALDAADRPATPALGRKQLQARPGTAVSPD
jgi:hypothetical protein